MPENPDMARRSTPRHPSDSGSSRWSRLRAAISTASAVLVIGSVLAGVTLGTPALERAAADRLATRDLHVTVKWPLDPDASETWMPQAFRDEILALAYSQLLVTRDRLSPEPLAAVGRALHETNWFASTPRVERISPDEILISGPWRVPAATIRIGSRDHLIASSGHLLPHSWDAGQSGIPVIVGLAYDPKHWPSDAARAALQLLRLLRDQPFREQVAGIDASRFHEAEMLGILTDSGSRVWWGAPPGSSAPERSEVRTEHKLRNLAEVHRITGRIDAGERDLVVYTDGVRLDRR